MSNLPYDAQIEYLESTGTQYINTGFTNTKSTEFIMDFQLTDATGDRKAIGQGFKFGLGQDANKWRVVDSQWYNTSIATDTLRHIAYTDNGKYYIDSTQIADRYSQKTAGTYPMLLFAVSSQNSVAPDGNPAKMKLYSCKIYDNGVLVRDFIPVRVGQVGYLYDKVTEELFGNAGTGSFTLGNDVVWSYGRNVVKGFRRRMMMGKGSDPLDEPIVFEDAAVKAICVQRWGGTDGGDAALNTRVNNTKVAGIAGEITYKQAASVTTFAYVFKSNTTIQYFTEMEYFTNVKYITDSMFLECTALEKVNLVNIIGTSQRSTDPADSYHNGFLNCTSLYDLGDTSNIVTLGDREFKSTAITSIDMPKLTTIYGPECFYGCQSLTSINLPNLVTAHNQIFQRCVKLTYANLPKLTTISYRYFYEIERPKIVAESLQHHGNNVYGDYWSFGDAFPAIIIGDKIESISEEAFGGGYSLRFRYIVIKATTPPTCGANILRYNDTCNIYVPDECVNAYKAASGFSTYASRIYSISQFMIDFPGEYE